jgi:hypothetical protein
VHQAGLLEKVLLNRGTGDAAVLGELDLDEL